MQHRRGFAAAPGDGAQRRRRRREGSLHGAVHARVLPRARA